MKNLTHRLMSLVAAATALALSGCIEESTVIKVNKDGSGVIHERSYSAGSDDVISLPGLSGDDADKKKDEKEEPKLPSEADLKAYAATLGKGVTFKSVKASTNKKGWKGYEILYEFKDINTVRYARDTPKPKKADDGDADEDEEKKKSDELIAVFAMNDGKLTVKLENDDFQKQGAAPVQESDGPTIDPYADAPGPSPAEVSIGSPAVNDSMMKAMTKGMRMGLFLQIDGEIADTNAAHRNGNLITLFNADLGKMFENEGGMAAVDKFEHVDRAGFQTMADQLDGLDIDLQEPIVVEIK